MKNLFTAVVLSFLFVGCFPLYKSGLLNVESQKVEFVVNDDSLYSKVLEWLFIDGINLKNLITYENKNVISGTEIRLLKPCKIFNETFKVGLVFDFFIRIETNKIVVVTQNPQLIYKSSQSASAQPPKPFYYTKCDCTEEVKITMEVFAKSIQTYLTK